MGEEIFNHMLGKLFQYYSFRIYILILGAFLVFVASVLPLIYPPLCYVSSPTGDEELVEIRTWTTPCITDLGYKELIDRPYLYATLAYFLGAVLVAIGWILMLVRIALDFRKREQIENYGIGVIGFIIITLLLLSSIAGWTIFGIFSPPGLGETRL